MAEQRLSAFIRGALTSTDPVPEIGHVGEDVLDLPPIDAVAAEHLIPYAIAPSGLDHTRIHLGPEERPYQAFTFPVAHDLYQRGSRELREVSEEMLCDEERMRLVALVVFIGRATWVVVHDVSKMNLSAWIPPTHGIALVRRMETGLMCPSTYSRLARHAQRKRS